ncbi:MAG: phosphotransferase system enzyme I (PtsP) [Alteromonadaceae bacterium]|jgi:phosphotransferase system enzyme I (PtsP)
MLTRLRSIVQDVNQEPDLTVALNNLVSHVKSAMQTECCSVYLADYEAYHFILRASDGLSPESIGQVSIGFSEGLIGYVGQREEPINIASAQTHPRYKETPEVKEELFNAFLGVPIINQRRVLGVISVQQKSSRIFDEDEEAFMVTLAVQLASVLAHAETRSLLQQEAAEKKAFGTQYVHCVPGSGGVAIGYAYVAHPVADFESVSLRKVYNSDTQIKRFYVAVRATRREFKEMALKLADQLPKDTLDIFDGYLQMLDSASFGADVEVQITNGWCAISALKIAIEKLISQFEAMNDVYIRERAADVRDLGHRVLGHLLQNEVNRKTMPDETILFAEEVTASMLAEIPSQQLLGVVSVKGSSNSHAAIMARALGVPAVMGVTDIPLLQLEGERIIIDGYAGTLLVRPPDDVIKEYQQLIAEEAQLQQELQVDTHLPAKSMDGESISLMLNAGLGTEYEYAQAVASDGIGLFRTEYLFMIKDSFPSEQEQYELYREVLSKRQELPVIMRILDIGGDKSLPYLPIVEDNPFLGWRGIRITLDHPEIFLVQVRAMIRANIDLGNLHIMLPMVSAVEEVDESIRLISQAYFEVSDETPNAVVTKPLVGIMIEVPSMLYLIDDLADKIDFCSVGSNDLTQYLLAVDRNNARVSSLYDYFHPAVLRALKDIIGKAEFHGISTSICGELAGDPGGAILLFAMGYRQLSMNASSLPKVKWVIRKLTMTECEDLLHRCLYSSRASEVRQLMNQFMESKGLGGLIRAGR